MKSTRNQLLQWVVALALTVLLINGLLFMYDRSPGWIERTGGSTDGVWRPNSVIIHGTEGFGINTVDNKGYLNPNIPLKDTYTLCIGSSHTQAKELASNRSYVAHLNTLMGSTGEALAVYNVSQDGYQFPAIVKNFKAICGEFPNATSMIIEVGTTNFPVVELREALTQVEYMPTSDGNLLYKNVTLRQKIKIQIKEIFPLLVRGKAQIGALRIKKAATDTTSADYNATMYRAALNDTLDLIRSEFQGTIVIVYHPTVCIDPDEGLQINALETDAIFAQLCEQKDIRFINLTNAFKKAYQEDYSVPYGFYNTSMGTGHLNAIGHQLIANELYRTLMEEE